MHPYRTPAARPIEPKPPAPPRRAAPLSSTFRLAVVAPLVFAAACINGTAKTTDDVKAEALTITEIACVFASALTDSAALAAACKIAPAAIPLIINLVGQREGAKRAGVLWPGAASDGGTDASTDAGR